MYKEAITGEFVCNWQNLLWTAETWIYSVLNCHSCKLKTAGTSFIFLDFVIDNLLVILWKLLKLEGVWINKSITLEIVTVKVSHDLKLMQNMSIQWNQQQNKTFENEFIAKDHQIIIIIDQIPNKWINYKIFKLK